MAMDSNDKSMSEVKQATGLANQVIIYAKNWYGSSDNIIEDIKKLTCHFCALRPEQTSDKEVWRILTTTFSDYVTNEFDRREALLHILSRHLGANPSFVPSPEEAMIGALSITEGGTVDMSKKDDKLVLGDK